MYLAELHGKLSSRIERLEDILTSNVFSFFKYSNREIFLKAYLLEKLGLNVTGQDAIDAEFIFWPRFEENTEPDLVIIVGDYYLLVEAKLFSTFGEETKNRRAQLLREIEGGSLEAKNYGKDFMLIAITSDHYRKEDKFRVIPRGSSFKWINWQSITSFLKNILEGNRNITAHERDFAVDLYNLLDKKNLRDYVGFENFSGLGSHLKCHGLVFFEAKTASFRGDFIGFTQSLSFEGNLRAFKKIFLSSKPRELFEPLSKFEKIDQMKSPIFYKET